MGYHELNQVSSVRGDCPWEMCEQRRSGDTEPHTEVTPALTTKLLNSLRPRASLPPVFQCEMLSAEASPDTQLAGH